MNDFLNNIDKIQAEIERDLEQSFKKPEPSLSDIHDLILEDISDSYPVYETTPIAAELPPQTESFYRETIKDNQKSSDSLTWRRVAMFLLVCTLGTGSLGFGLGFGWGYFSDGDVLYVGEEATVTLSGTITTTHYVFDNVSGDPEAGSLADIVAFLEPSVVNITAYSEGFFGEQTNIGSGIIFAENDERIFIVTNDYIVGGGDRVTVRVSGSPPLEARPVGSYSNADLNVISVDKTQLLEAGIDSVVIATFGDSSQMRVGDTVLAIGNAMGEGNSVTRGVISAPEMEVTIIGRDIIMLQTDAAINHGSSGGPLINTRGEVVGININRASNHIFGMEQVEGMGYSIASNVATPILNNLISYRRPGLGISGQTVTEVIAERWGIPVLGVYVAEVLPGRAAYIGGMLPGDIITGFNGQPVFYWDQLAAAIRNSEVGDSVEIRILRDGRHPLTLTIELDLLIVDNF